MRQESEVNVVRDEGGERGKTTAEGVQNFEESAEGMLCVVKPVFAFQSSTVEANVPIRCIVNEL